MPEKLTFDVLKQAVAGNAAAFRCVAEYHPAGGPGDKVFPPTYKDGKDAKYAEEERRIDGEIVPCVLLDSVQSQANRMELALLEAVRAGRITIPVVSVRFDQDVLKKKFAVTSLEAPHRVADAIFRDSLLDGVVFRESEKGRVLDTAEVKNATGLFGLCPTALVFGVWDSTGPRGGLGAKFQRALVSEMVGWGAQKGIRSGSRLDPLQVVLGAGPLYQRAEKTKSAPAWTLDENAAAKEKGQPKKLGKDGKGKPSEANHGNVTPYCSPGGFTISKATQTTVLSLAALRRLRFPLNGNVDSEIEVDRAARTALAALGLAAAVLSREDGCDLRSRCQLFPAQEFVWDLLDAPGAVPKSYLLDGGNIVEILSGAVVEAKSKGLPWDTEIPPLTPHPELLKLVCRSQELIIKQGEEGGE